ncbi:hypothetical protein Axy21_023 [Achromobacter phage vB_AxyP_19-32_Axy21]|uniref:Exonuclease n=1 Tax=Achromobacter phage vB_AxyP_19-32_Axy21 TaxID=2591045 RepID=A0A514CVQ9_9CAUD|nr:hypothetical protein Axy21_023 [Achromobacter phage vB_AxyP_19-32_Axy21]
MFALPFSLDEIGVHYDTKPGQAGRVLIYDGDFLAYAISSKYKTLATCIRHYQQCVLEAMFLAQCDSATVHLTGAPNYKAGRHRTLGVQPYQGNRKGKPKPALLEPLRQAMGYSDNWLREFNVVLHYDREADDGMMTQAYALRDRGIIRSGDKDLRMTPYPYFDEYTGMVLTLPPGSFGWTGEAFTPSGKRKLAGHGPKFFWLQMLAGDRADHIKGILTLDGKKCAEAGAVAALADLNDPDDVANFVLDAYRAIDQNPLPEAYCLWLLRWPDDSASNAFSERRLSAANLLFLADCYRRRWFVPDEEYDAGSEYED